MGTRVMIMAGGTGGHVFPALATANRLREQGVEIEWLGTHNGLEADVVPAAGIRMHWVSISGLRGKGKLALLTAPFRLLWACTQVATILIKVRPSAVLGMGGFVSGPGGLMAWLLRCPLVIHEQNAIAGLTNRWLSPLARRVLTGFPNVFPKRPDAEHVGNPVRTDIAALEAPSRRMNERPEELRLLVLGGSLGAAALNEVVPQALARLPANVKVTVLHQCGRKHLDKAQAAYAEAGVEGRVQAFIDDMADAYGWADLVICRAGALTIAELAAAGVGAILVPYPYAVDDHQAANAAYMVESGAGVMVRQNALNVEGLSAQLSELAQNRESLLEMARAARVLARPDATDVVARACLEVARHD